MGVFVHEKIGAIPAAESSEAFRNRGIRVRTYSAARFLKSSVLDEVCDLTYSTEVGQPLWTAAAGTCRHLAG